MSQFFRQLIDLGEERDQAVELSLDDPTKMTSEELMLHIRKLDARLAEQRVEYDKLQADSLSLRSEYDAYKKKVDGWQRQMKEARAADKKMIDELRAAGSSGKIDDVYMKSTTDTIQQLKENLREAQEEVQKAFKRQREAEESRVAAEQSKKVELEALGAKFDAFKDRSKASQERLENQLRDLRAAATKESSSASSTAFQQLKSQLEMSERQRTTLQKRLDALLSGRQGQHQSEHDGGDAADANDSSEDVSSSHQGGGGASSASPHDSATVSLLQGDIQQLQSHLAIASVKETELHERLRKSEEKLQRQVEDAQWEALEAGKRMAEAKTEVDMLKTRISQLESKLDAKEEEYLLNEKQSRRAQRDLEDALTSEKDRHSADVRELQQQRLLLEQELQVERERSAHHTELIGEAETASRKTNEALETQRRHFEKIIAEKDAILQQLHGVRESLEISIQEAKTDARHKMDVLDELRRELDQSSERVVELENQQLMHQRSLNAREEEVQSRETERQKLRMQLRQEEDSNAKLRSTISSLEARISEMEMEYRRKDAALLESDTSKSLAISEATMLKATLADAHKTSRQQEQHIQELNRRIQDQGMRNSDIIRFRDDQSAQIRSLEQRNSDLEQELRTFRHGDDAVTSSGSPSFSAAAPQRGGNGAGASIVDIIENAVHKASPAAIKKQFITEAMATVRQQRFLSLSNYRVLIMIAVGVFLFLSMFSGIRTATQTTALSETDTINTLREKYGQALVATGSCRELLNTAREQISTMCACSPK